MDSVFVSYCHRDSDFVDRLVADLRLSSVPATYDKWLLRVGDSIIERLSAAVSSANHVVAVLSEESIGSRWVAKELSMAMTGEVNGREIRVLPAVLDDCQLPPMLADKLYADFREGYYVGLRAILRSLNATEAHERYQAKEKIQRDRDQLATLVESGDRQSLLVWLLTHGYALAALLGRLWAVSEAFPASSFPGGDGTVDFVVVNGQSFSYDISLVHLGAPILTEADLPAALAAVQKLDSVAKTYRKNEADFRRGVASRLENGYGASQIAGPHPYERELKLDAKLICGRRAAFELDGNKFRKEVSRATRGRVEVISYDRVVEALDMLLTTR